MLVAGKVSGGGGDAAALAALHRMQGTLQIYLQTCVRTDADSDAAGARFYTRTHI